MLAGVETRGVGGGEHAPASLEVPDHPTRDAGFGVYLHWPFCASKCPYCDFNSHVRHAGIDEPRFLAAFRREIAHAAALAPGRTVTSIFLGGGTPSLMQPATVAGLLDAVAEAWGTAPDVEVTLEANPTSVEAGRFRGYRVAGVNRVSLGVQALDDGDLKSLGRLHSVAEALAAVETAAAHFERFSFDLIYARPRQTPQAWRTELRRAIERAAEHLSLYQLTIEPGTPFYGLAQAGRLVPPDDEQARVLYDLTQEVCDRAGLPAYEISNHARPGAESRHNLLYWRYGEYAGIGPGAHGRLVIPRPVDGGGHSASPRPLGEGDRAQRGGVGSTAADTGACGAAASVRFAATSPKGGGEAGRMPNTSVGNGMIGAERIATITERTPEAWLARVEREGHGIVETETIAPETQADEFLMMGLRLAEGIDPARYAALAGRPLDAGRLDALVCDGLMTRREDGRIAATARGAPVLNALVAELAR